MSEPLKITIEDTGLGVTLPNDPGKYRVWKSTDADGFLFLVLTRSVIHIHDHPVPATAPIDRYVALTEEMLKRNPSPAEVLAALVRE